MGVPLKISNAGRNSNILMSLKSMEDSTILHKIAGPSSILPTNNPTHSISKGLQTWS